MRAISAVLGVLIALSPTIIANDNEFSINGDMVYVDHAYGVSCYYDLLVQREAVDATHDLWRFTTYDGLNLLQYGPNPVDCPVQIVREYLMLRDSSSTWVYDTYENGCSTDGNIMVNEQLTYHGAFSKAPGCDVNEELSVTFII